MSKDMGDPASPSGSSSFGSSPASAGLAATRSIPIASLLLRHYSDTPVLSVSSTVQRAPPDVDMKPRGLWLSVDSCEDNWRSWCEGESFGLDRLACAHDVTLAADANILRLRGAADIDSFTREFAAPHEIAIRLFIDWRAVAARWQGIIIAPYVWSRRLDGDASWYYGWDCASGCIWDAAAIAGIAPAQGIDARSDETRSGSALLGESPTPKGMRPDDPAAPPAGEPSPRPEPSRT